MDIFYPESSSSAPALLIVCAFTKFVCARFIPSLKPVVLISVLLNHWSCLFGLPETIICDRGTHFQGSEWQAICNTHATKMVMAPTAAHYQVGTVERQVEMVKRMYRKLDSTSEAGFSKQDKLSLVCGAKNITPSSTSMWSPLYLVTGRSDHLSGLLNACAPSSDAPKNSLNHIIWQRMLLMREIRGSLLKLDAKYIVDLTQRKRLRCNDSTQLRHNDAAVVWLPDMKRWSSGFRFLFDSGKNSILERGSRLVKIPSHWVKPLIQEQTGAGAEESEKGKDITTPDKNEPSSSSCNPS